MNAIPLYVFDLDGTLADLKHRRRFVELQNGSPVTVTGTPAIYRGLHASLQDNVWVEFPETGVWAYDESEVKFKKNWDAFHAACVDDTPIPQIIGVLDALYQSIGAHIWIWSGRSDSVMEHTKTWLKLHCPYWTRLKMRDHGDYTPDDQLKESWLKAMNPEDRARLVMAFDDRDRVVNMWRRNGVICAQVAPGDF